MIPVETSDLKLFQDFLRRNFKSYKKYDKMRPVTNQPANLFATAKTHKIYQHRRH